ncbi:MAG: hypothetical protein WCI76_03605 [bacterium]
MKNIEKFSFRQLCNQLEEIRTQIENLKEIENSLLSVLTTIRALADSQGDVIESLYRIESKFSQEESDEAGNY